MRFQIPPCVVCILSLFVTAGWGTNWAIAQAYDQPGEHGGVRLSLVADGDAPEREGEMDNGFDPGLVESGREAFFRACVSCHDAERSTERSKSLSAWIATVRRMAAKDGAEVAPSDVLPIATYLADLAGPGVGSGGADGAAAALASGWSFSATISPVWRGSSDPIENPGFFPDVWLGVDWQSEGPLRASVMTCTSCHSDSNLGKGFTLEFVEASATLDLRQIFSGCWGVQHEGIGAELKAGRFVVPFGAFAGISHPGSYRTISNPLMFNMARRITSGGPFQPVVHAPYSDEGANLALRIPVHCETSATLDLYVVNGLQGGGPGTLFDASRSYVDNNREPAFGARATIGNRAVRFGGSLKAGQLQNEGTTPQSYHMVGADVTARYQELVRFYFEYALRRDDTVVTTLEQNITYGIVTELELMVWKQPNIGLLGRYDTLEHRHAFSGDLSTERFTWGFNIPVKGSMLLLNHEHWMFPGSGTDVDVVGVRWTSTF